MYITLKGNVTRILVSCGESHIKKKGCSSYFLGVKNADLVPHRLFSLKRSTARAFAVPLGYWSKNIWQEIRRCFGIGHYTVVCLVTWPMNTSEAGGDLILIQTSLLFLFKWQLVSARTTWFTQQKQWGLYQNNVTCSLAAIQRPGHWTDNCEMVYFKQTCDEEVKNTSWLLTV